LDSELAKRVTELRQKGRTPNLKVDAYPAG